MEYVLLIVCACGAGFVQRTVGFGFGIFLIPLLFLLGVMGGDYKSIVSLSSMMAATLSLITVWDLRKSLDWRFIWPLLIVFIPTSTFFSYVMFGTDASWLKIILGITLILLSIYFTFFKKDGIKIKPNWFNTISLGSLSGLMGGLFSMQGPPVVYYYLSTQKTKEEYMAQTQCFFFSRQSMDDHTACRRRNNHRTSWQMLSYCHSWLSDRHVDRSSHLQQNE